MLRLDPHIELLVAAGGFASRPGPAQQAELARLAPAAREVYEILPPLYQQLVVACERVAAAPAIDWPLAAAGLRELILAIPAAAVEAAPAAPSQPIICPHCGELSASPYLCDVCGEAIRQRLGEVA